MSRTEYLVDLLSSASIDAPGANHVELQEMILAREVETAIFQHPSSTITFPALEIGKQAVLQFACGIKEAAWPLIKSAVRFTISIESAGKRQRVFETKLQPRTRKSDRGWQKHELDISRYAGQSIRVILRTSVAWRQSTEYAWAGWANPRVVHTVSASTPVIRRDDYPHIFLLTADALASRYLGCYGHPKALTPHLDQLAVEGVLIEQAWSQSCMTLGSYVSILTGQHPRVHGVSREWQPFPVSQVNLPTVLEAHGYHTLFAAGSRELSGRSNDLDQVFKETVPMLSNPMQDSAVTNRQFIRRFEQRPDRPCFSWIHYFDVHPPTMPPEPFNSMYYAGDPTDEQNQHLASKVAEIRCVESLLILRAAMPLLERGQPVAEVVDILEDTAAVLKGESNSKPDLAEHVINFGARAMQGHSSAEFGKWLAKQTAEMASGQVSPALVEWLKDVMTLLEQTEIDIMSWLSGVVDFRYPLSIYLSTISYLDAQINVLTNYLKESGLYDQSLIIFAAPHGELLDNSSIPYHHFLLAPDTLHVPLIIKPPKQASTTNGSRIGGVFDLIDIFPTILDIQGLPTVSNLSGVSRWDEIRSGRDIPPHDSFAAGPHQLAHSVFRSPYLLARAQAEGGMETFHSLVSGAREVLYDTRSGETYLSDMPEVAGSLRESLDAQLNAGLNAGRKRMPT
jgi:arylsulfatase A-like enzyme